mgnify:CR=1 FL=1
MSQDLEGVGERVGQRESELNHQIAQNASLQADNQDMLAHLAAKEDEIAKVKRAQQQANRLVESLKRKVEQMEGQKRGVEEDNHVLKVFFFVFSKGGEGTVGRRKKFGFDFAVNQSVDCSVCNLVADGLGD